MRKQAQFQYETAQLRKLLRTADAPIEQTVHARQRLKERGISELDIRQCLRTGKVIGIDMSGQGRTAWLVEARVEGRMLRVVIGEPNFEPGPTVTVVTAFFP